ncbi:MAG: fasciclin domain-containing protein [Paludibacter sp.]|nr:fasciclin domain-containing protein [Paludibacter sp.]
MYKTFIKKVLLTTVLSLTMTGCFLELQSDYEYESSVMDPHVNMTAWEYFETRTDLFSIFMSAVEYTDMKAYFTQTETKYTFLALTNVAMKSYMQDRFPGATDITECDKASVKKLIEYHLVDGEYSSYHQLKVEPMYVLTLLKGEEGLMTMLTRKNPWQADAGKVVVNDTGSNGSSYMRLAVTSNIMPTNGVIHVFDAFCYYKR